MKRRELREHIFELLFRVEFNERDEMPEQMRLFFESLPELSPEDQAYMQKKYERIMEKLPEIDRLLGETAEGWKVSRMGKTDLTVLRRLHDAARVQFKPLAVYPASTRDITVMAPATLSVNAINRFIC